MKIVADMTFIVVGGTGGRGGIKMASANTQSEQGPHFSPHITAEVFEKSTETSNSKTIY